MKSYQGYLYEHPIYSEKQSYLEHMTNTALLKTYNWASDFCINKCVLEIGCGDLGGAELLLRKSPAKQYYGIDYNINALIAATKRQSKTKILCSKGEEIPFKDSSFDVILTFQVLEHIVEYEKFLEEIHRLIRPDGILLLSTPDLQSRPDDPNPWHVSLFDKPGLAKLLNKHFEEVEMLYQYGADRTNLNRLAASGINMPDEYIQAVNTGYKIGQISRKNIIVNWMIGSGRKGKIFKYLPLFIVNLLFKVFTGYDYHWYEFKHIPYISKYPFPCLSFFCVCKVPKR